MILKIEQEIFRVSYKSQLSPSSLIQSSSGETVKLFPHLRPFGPIPSVDQPTSPKLTNQVTLLTPLRFT